MRILLLSIFIFASGQVVAGTNPFEKLPFGIVVGQTTNKEIENRGTCFRQIEVRPNHFRCEYYNLPGGVEVQSSQNEIVKGVFIANEGGRFPRTWRDAGISFDLEIEAFMYRLSNMEGVYYLKKEVTYHDDGDKHTADVTFESGAHFFKVTFFFYTTVNKMRLFSVTEAY